MLDIANPDRQPYAELWMGAHPKAPSKVAFKDRILALDELIAIDPDRLLGQACARRYSAQLPYLFKILDAEQMLSIQVHPSKAMAEEGFDRENSEGVALDAKFNIDNSGLFRQPEIPRRLARGPEERARELGISYVLLDGNIGIISNGAGLTMSAMDYIRLKGASPANFLDLGGGATQAVTIKNGIGIVLENPAVSALLIYIFAGGPRCDVIAEGIVEACFDLETEGKLNVPIVVTLHGRYAEEGKKIIERCESSYVIHVLEVEDAVNKAIELGGGPK